MRPSLPLFFALAAVLPIVAHAKDPAQVDASKQNTQLAPTPESADMPLSPRRETNQRTFFRNELVQDQRFSVPDQVQRKDAVVGERRAPIDMKESRGKTVIDRKDYPKPEVRDRELNRHDGERSRIQPDGDMVKKYDNVSKYQDGMKDAKTAAIQREPKLEKRTTFEKLNRFIFKRNSPGTPDGKPMVTTAGGEAPPLQDTHTQYRVDWKRMDGAK